jgi:hypothetical protein
MYCLCTRCIIVNSVQVRSEFGKFAYTAICMRKCTLWFDNTCVFTRFHSVKNANTQLIWSSAVSTDLYIILALWEWGLGLWCLTPLSTIFKLYRGGQFSWWRKPEYPEKSTVLSLTNISHNVASSTPCPNGIPTHNLSGDRHWLHRYL